MTDATPQRPRRIPLRGLAAGLIALTAISVVTVKVLDASNEFCISCHLHEDIYKHMTTTPPTTLTAAHFHAKHPRHAERCFTCHSGEGVVGWSQVTLLSAWDAARWVAGDRHEPTRMRLPLTNDACLKCHAKDVQGTMSVDETSKYHELSAHNGKKLTCATCHVTHAVAPADKNFLNAPTVRAQCQKCHRERVGEGEEGL
jgi:nitrate/TMAO reductase-like tetraheme cytochrome c subunit